MELVRCKNFLSKFRGLMFRFPKDLVLINKKPKKLNLHTLFVFFYIDILFLDGDFKIIKIYKKVRPFRFYIKGVKSKYIVELRDSNFKVGDKINIF